MDVVRTKQLFELGKTVSEIDGGINVRRREAYFCRRQKYPSYITGRWK
jgi:hypothetical protein